MSDAKIKLFFIYIYFLDEHLNVKKHFKIKYILDKYKKTAGWKTLFSITNEKI